MDTKGYTDRSNCIRAARKQLGIPAGKAGVDFHILTGEDGLFRFAPVTPEPAQPAPVTETIVADGPGNDNLVSDGELLSAVAAAMESGTLAQTAEVLAMKQKAAAKPKRADMATMMGSAMCSLTINSAQNSGYQKHADAMFQLAQKGDAKALGAYKIKGTNTYCRMLRRYQAGLIGALSAKTLGQAA